MNFRIFAAPSSEAVDRTRVRGSTFRYIRRPHLAGRPYDGSTDIETSQIVIDETDTFNPPNVVADATRSHTGSTLVNIGGFTATNPINDQCTFHFEGTRTAAFP